MHKTGLPISALHLLARARACVYSSIIGLCVQPWSMETAGKRERRAGGDTVVLVRTTAGVLTLSRCHVGLRPRHHSHAQMLQER